MSKAKKILKLTASVFVIILVSLLLLEILLYFLYQNYQISKNISPLKIILRQINRAQTDIIQSNPNCAQYDKDLFYTLKPGNCNFKNQEFNTKYEINSAGVRDSEDALKKPEIIVLGDSYAMGWGVEKEETFAHLIGEGTKLKTLNAGVSSYGTAREYLMLKKMDLSNLKYLVIQYCDNDYGENKPFVKNNFVLKISSKEDYQAVTNKNVNKAGKYKLFRFSSITIREFVRNFKGSNHDDDLLIHDTKEFEYLSKILYKIRALVGNNVEIIIFETIGENANTSRLPDYFRDNKVDLGKFKTINTKDILTDNDYFILDSHINKDGHKKIANAVIQIINQK